MNWLHPDKEFRQRFWYSVFGILAVVVGCYVFLQSATYMLVIITGLIMATVMTNLIRYLCKKINVPYVVMYIATWIVVIGVPFGALYLSIPQLDGQITELKESIQALGDPDNNLPVWIPARSYIESEIASFDLGSFFNQSVAIGRLSNLAFTVGSILTGVVVLMFIALYASLSPDVYKKTLLSFVRNDKRAYIEKKLTTISKALSSWIVARLFSMVAVGLLTFFGLLLIGMPQAFFLALLAGLLSFVPNIGPIVAVVPAALVAVLQSPLLLLYVIILYIVVQTVESYFITPFVQQRVVATPPAILISTQVIFGVLFGIMGLILAAPVLAIVFAFQKEGSE